jgi:hypothetical protein
MKQRLTILLLFISFFAFSQNSYLNGYIILKDETKLKGQVQFDQSIDNLKEVNYRSDENLTSHVYYLRQIKKVFIEPDIVFVNEKNGLDDEILVKQLVKGKVYLYKSYDKSGVSHYYIKKNNSSLVEINNSNYKGQLLYYLTKDRKIAKRTKKLIFEEESLTNLAKDYNHNYFKKLTKPDFLLGLGLGYQVINTKFVTNADWLEFSLGEYDPGHSFFPSLFVEYFVHNTNEKVSISAEVNYYKYKIKGESNIRTRFDTYGSFSHDYIFNYTHLSLNGNYYMYLNPFNIHLSAGIGNAFSKMKKAETLVVLNTMGQINEKTMHYFSDFKDELSLHLGMGLSYNNYSIDFEYRAGRSLFSNYIGITSETNSFAVLFIYKIDFFPTD